MPQMFQVLRCYKCSVFQVHQTKKSNKFECKMCGEKQSIKRHYGIGNGQECRKHVQKLNCFRGDMDEMNKSTDISDCSDRDDNDEFKTSEIKIKETSDKSKWSEYIETETPNDAPDIDEDVMYLDDKKVVLELPSRKRKRKIDTKYARRSKKSQDSRNNYHDEDNNLVNFNDIGDTSNSEIQYNDLKYEKIDILNDKNETLLPTNINSVITESDKNKLNDINLNIANKETQMTTSNKTYEVKAKFVPPAINKNSKWATFINDNEGKNENELNSDTETISSENIPRGLFSLCDDDELDNFLVI